MKGSLFYGVIIFLLAFSAFNIVLGSVGGANIDLVFTQSQLALNALNSIQFDSACDYELSENLCRKLGTAGNSFTSKSRFYEQNGKYRSEASFEDWQNGQKMNSISLYNGEKFQLYDVENGLLTHSKEARLPNTSITPNPLLMPYIFLLTHDRGNTLSLDNLRNPKTWEELAADAHWNGVKRIREYECAVIDIPMGPSLEHGFFQRVYFAKDLRYLPIRIETWIEKDKMIGMLDVDNIKEHRTGNGNINIPVSVKVVDYDESGEISQVNKMTISADTLKVNEPINEAIFEMSPYEAKSFVDSEYDIFVTINQSLLPVEDMMKMDEAQITQNGQLEQTKNTGTYKDQSPSSSEGQKVLEATNKTVSLSSDVKFEKKRNQKILIILSSGLIILAIVVISISRRKKMFIK